LYKKVQKIIYCQIKPFSTLFQTQNASSEFKKKKQSLEACQIAENRPNPFQNHLPLVLTFMPISQLSARASHAFSTFPKSLSAQSTALKYYLYPATNPWIGIQPGSPTTHPYAPLLQKKRKLSVK
jgi:hypothetical protein